MVNITVSHPGLLRYLAMTAGFAAPQQATPAQMRSPSKALTSIQPQPGSESPAGTTFGAALWSNLPVPLPVQSLKVRVAFLPFFWACHLRGFLKAERSFIPLHRCQEMLSDSFDVV